MRCITRKENSVLKHKEFIQPVKDGHDSIMVWSSFLHFGSSQIYNNGSISLVNKLPTLIFLSHLFDFTSTFWTCVKI